MSRISFWKLHVRVERTLLGSNDKATNALNPPFKFPWKLICRAVLVLKEICSNLSALPGERWSLVSSSIFRKSSCRLILDGLGHVEQQCKSYRRLYIWNQDDTRNFCSHSNFWNSLFWRKCRVRSPPLPCFVSYVVSKSYIFFRTESWLAGFLWILMIKLVFFAIKG